MQEPERVGERSEREKERAAISLLPPSACSRPPHLLPPSALWSIRTRPASTRSTALPQRRSNAPLPSPRQPLLLWPRSSPRSPRVFEHTDFSLNLKTHAELIEIILAQQVELNAHRDASQAEAEAKVVREAKEKANAVAAHREMMYKSIAASMGWKRELSF